METSLTLLFIFVIIPKEAQKMFLTVIVFILAMIFTGLIVWAVVTNAAHRRIEEAKAEIRSNCLHIIERFIPLTQTALQFALPTHKVVAVIEEQHRGFTVAIRIGESQYGYKFFNLTADVTDSDISVFAEGVVPPSRHPLVGRGEREVEICLADFLLKANQRKVSVR